MYSHPQESPHESPSAAWAALTAKHDLAEADVTRLASWWHTDANLGRPMEVVTHMSKSRKAGFVDYQSTADAFSRCSSGGGRSG